MGYLKISHWTWTSQNIYSIDWCEDCGSFAGPPIYHIPGIWYMAKELNSSGSSVDFLRRGRTNACLNFWGKTPSPKDVLYILAKVNDGSTRFISRARGGWVEQAVLELYQRVSWSRPLSYHRTQTVLCSDYCSMAEPGFKCRVRHSWISFTGSPAVESISVSHAPNYIPFCIILNFNPAQSL